MIFSFFKKDKQLERATDLYGDIVEQARSVPFYADLEVPDTVAGRFDMITIHMFLVLRRLKQAEDHQDFAQKLFNIMFQNMDDSLRELGVGDLSVGKKVRHLAEAFYGRMGAYEAALDGQDEESLTNAIAKNVYGSEEENAAPTAELLLQAKLLATYMLAAEQHLKAQTSQRIMSGIVSFPDIQVG